jgi:hypothetical protein
MKKYIYILAAFIALGAANAQSVEMQRMSFRQTLFPKKKLASNIRNYNCAITTPYLKDDSSFRKIAEDKYQQDLKDYPNTVAAAQNDYQATVLPEYEKSVAAAKEKFKLESDAFNKMSTLERLALIDQKPILNIPPKPVFYPPAKPNVESVNTNDIIIYNPETLAKNYIKLNGFGDGNDGLQITIDFKGFQYVEPVATVVDVENYNQATKEKFYTKQTQFVTQFRHPTMLNIKADGKELYSGIFQQTGDYQTKATSSKPERIYIEREEVVAILRNINKFLNDEYGYVNVDRSVPLYYVKNKKGEYDDIEKAKDFAASGYKNYTEHEEDAVKDLQSAIDIWEKTMTEVNYDDSKARIDEKVGMAVMKNLIVSSIFTRQFEKAEKYMGDFKSRRLNYDDKQFLEYYQQASADLKARG